MTSGSNLKAVAVICADLGGAGAVSNVAIQQMKSFGPQTHVHFVSDSLRTHPGFEAEEHLLKHGTYHGLRRFGHVPREVSFGRHANRFLMEIAEKAGPLDWVIVHSHVVAALISPDTLKKLGAKLALVVHGDVYDRPIKTYGLSLSMLYRWAAPRAYQNADQIFTLSKTGYQLAVQAGAAESKTRVFPNGVDLDEVGLSGVARQNFVPKNDVLKILFVGRLSFEKGLDILLNACALLSSRNVPYELTVIGDGPEKEQLLRLVKSLEIEGKVNFLGKMLKKDIGVRYSDATVVCIPSRSDPFPLVGLETMASGALLAASPVGGLVELLSDECGLLVGDNSPESWADTMQRVNDQPTQFVVVAKKGMEKVLNQYNWQQVSAKFHKILVGAGNVNPSDS